MSEQLRRGKCAIITSVATVIITAIIVAGIAVVIVVNNELAVLGDGNRQFLVASSSDSYRVVAIDRKNFRQQVAISAVMGDRVGIIIPYHTRGISSTVYFHSSDFADIRGIVKGKL